MEIEAIFRELAAVANRAWYNCENQANRELLSKVGFALQEVADERHKKRAEAAAHDSRMATYQARHDAEESDLRSRMPQTTNES